MGDGLQEGGSFPERALYPHVTDKVPATRPSVSAEMTGDALGFHRGTPPSWGPASGVLSSLSSGRPPGILMGSGPPVSQPNHRKGIKKLWSAWVVLTGPEFVAPELFESSVRTSTRVITTDSTDQSSKNMHDEARCYQNNGRNMCLVCRRPTEQPDPSRLSA